MENGGRVESILNHLSSSQFIFALGVEQLVGAVVIRGRHEDAGGPVQIAIVRRGGIHEFLRGGYAVFFQHHHEHLGVHDRTGVKQFHAENLAATGCR